MATKATIITTKSRIAGARARTRHTLYADVAFVWDAWFDRGLDLVSRLSLPGNAYKVA